MSVTTTQFIETKLPEPVVFRNRWQKRQCSRCLRMKTIGFWAPHGRCCTECCNRNIKCTRCNLHFIDPRRHVCRGAWCSMCDTRVKNLVTHQTKHHPVLVHISSCLDNFPHEVNKLIASYWPLEEKRSVCNSCGKQGNGRKSSRGRNCIDGCIDSIFSLETKETIKRLRRARLESMSALQVNEPVSMFRG